MLKMLIMNVDEAISNMPRFIELLEYEGFRDEKSCTSGTVCEE